MYLFALSSPDLAINPLIDKISHGFSDTILPSHSNNIGSSKGKIELKVTELHTKILNDAQKTWYQSLPDDFDFAKKPQYKNSLSAIFSEIDSDHTVLVHDPLLCRLLPLWSSLDTNSINLLHYSEPLECAINLQKAWRFPLSVGLALWENYMLEAAKNLPTKTSVLLSSNKLRNSGKRHLSSVCNKLEKLSDEKLKLENVSIVNPASLINERSNNDSELMAYVSPQQQLIFECLEKNKLGAIKKLNLSEQSADLLNYYGQMRAGFEAMKDQHQEQTKELTRTKRALAAVNNAKADSRDANNQDQNNVSTGNNLAEQLQSMHSEAAIQQNLVAVKIVLRGMPALEFLSPPDSPVLDMLNQHLLSSSEKDEMIYLNSVGPDSEAMYFMASSLLAIETQPVTHH